MWTFEAESVFVCSLFSEKGWSGLVWILCRWWEQMMFGLYVLRPVVWSQIITLKNTLFRFINNHLSFLHIFKLLISLQTKFVFCKKQSNLRSEYFTFCSRLNLLSALYVDAIGLYSIEYSHCYKWAICLHVFEWSVCFHT